MNVLVLIGLGLVASAFLAMAGFPINKAAGHRVVIEFHSAEPEAQERVLDHAEALRQTLGPRTEVAIIAHGDGLRLLVKSEAPVAQRIAGLAKERVAFVACERSLRRQQLAREHLLPGVATVDSGVAEIVRRQTAGWSYLKAG